MSDDLLDDDVGIFRNLPSPKKDRNKERVENALCFCLFRRLFVPKKKGGERKRKSREEFKFKIL